MKSKQSLIWFISVFLLKLFIVPVMMAIVLLKLQDRRQKLIYSITKQGAIFVLKMMRMT